MLLVMVGPGELDSSMTSTATLATWGLSGIFLFGMVWAIAITWWMSRPDRFEPPSEITSACSISRDISQFFEGRRHLYGFRNRESAKAFERANHARVWTERDQALMWKKWLVATLLLIAVLGGGRLLLLVVPRALGFPAL